jgi:hypothetical protein
MWVLRRAVLEGSISTSEVSSAVVLGKDSKEFRAVAKLSTLIHDNLIVGGVRCVASKPAIEPFDGGLLGLTSGVLDLATAVVGDSDVAGFTTEASALFEMLGVLGGLDDEAKISPKSLKASSCFARIVFALSHFVELGRKAEVVQLLISAALGNSGMPLVVGFGETAGLQRARRWCQRTLWVS